MTDVFQCDNKEKGKPERLFYIFIHLFSGLFLRSMISRTRCARFARHDFLPEIVTMISILIIIHCSNKFDEYTGNQYILEDNDHDRPEGACALYPSSMQGKSIFMSMVYSPISFVGHQGGKEEILTPEHLEWSDNADVQLGRDERVQWGSFEHGVIPSLGGMFSPTDCKSRQELALIIPYRNREYHLKLLLKHLHPFLQRQKRAYQIIVVEQVMMPSLIIHAMGIRV